MTAIRPWPQLVYCSYSLLLQLEVIDTLPMIDSQSNSVITRRIKRPFLRNLLSPQNFKNGVVVATIYAGKVSKDLMLQLGETLTPE